MNKIERSIQYSVLFALAILLSSCLRATTTETPQISQPTTATAATASETAPPSAAPTYLYTPTFTTAQNLAIASAPTIIPRMYPPRSMGDDEQLYLGPDGWFSVYVPADWDEGETPGFFSGEDGFAEIRCLPELGFMDRILSVYVWLANIVEQPENTNIFLEEKFRTITETGETVDQFVFKNPAAEYEHRFVLIKADEEHIGRIEKSFRWLRPTTQVTELDYHQMEPRPEDVSFWDSVVPLQEGISLMEYELIGEAQTAESLNFIRIHFPAEALALEYELREKYSSSPPEKPSDEEILAAFGYELKEYYEPHREILYRDGKPFIENVRDVGGISVFPAPSGEIIVFVVNAVSGDEQPLEHHSYIVKDHTIIEREYRFGDPYHHDPVMKDGELLWVRYSGAHVRVENIHEEILFDFSTWYGVSIPLKFFRGWENHWVLGVGNFIIQDGEILNEKYGYEEVFGWRIVNDKPLYFFRKGNRLGISYDGEVLPLYYHDIPQVVFGLRGNGSVTWGNYVRFYGQRDGVWYVVMMEFE